jgi:acetolactate synthase-1/2/3 large subunit
VPPSRIKNGGFSATSCPILISDADKQAIEIAVEMIEKAKYALVLIGAGANRNKLLKPVQDFIDKTCIPFFNTQMGKGVVSCKSPLFLGTAAL